MWMVKIINIALKKLRGLIRENQCTYSSTKVFLLLIIFHIIVEYMCINYVGMKENKFYY
jgi:hypothetical protein